MANASVLEQGATAASETFDELFHIERYRCAKNSYVYIATDAHPSVIECYANAASEVTMNTTGVLEICLENIRETLVHASIVCL